MSPAEPEPRIVVVFRNDDVSALSDLEHEREIFEIFERFGVPQTMGVIPCISASDFHSKEIGPVRPLSDNLAVCDFLRRHVARTNSEIALHGYTHRTNRHSMPRRREYFEFKQLPLVEQENMLRQGLAILEQALDVRPKTFIPPWNRLDRTTMAACAQVGLHIVSAGWFTSRTDDVIACGTNTNIQSFGEHWVEAKRSSRRMFLHVLLHSRTTKSAGEKRLLASAVDVASRDSECAVMTVGDAVARFPSEIDQLNEAGRNIVAFSEVPDSDRARLWLYLKLAPRLAARTAPILTAHSAVRLYRQGNYAACARLSEVINRQSRRLLWLSRGGVAVAASVFALAASASLNKLLSSAHSHCLWAGALLPVLAGGILAAKATAKQTRRESLLAGLIAAAGIIAALSFLWICL